MPVCMAGWMKTILTEQSIYGNVIEIRFVSV